MTVDQVRGGCKPFIKWPGGKRAIIDALLRHVPATYGTYYEPFLGSGALFFAARPERAVLADTNADLIECYVQIRDRPQDVMDQLTHMRNSREEYYTIRDWSPVTAIERAARLIYLVNLSFNGIYRVNFQGQFNVPYGYRTHRAPFSETTIMAASNQLTNARLQPCDFGEALADARAGDFVYLDPPYTVAHSRNGFVRYNDRLFSWKDQERLAKLAYELVNRGCHVVVTNAHASAICNLYSNFAQYPFSRLSLIAAQRRHRRPVEELVIVGRPQTVGESGNGKPTH